MKKRILRSLTAVAVFALAFVSCDELLPFWADATQLEPANSFIISAPGLYAFSPVRGNSSEPVGSVSSAEVLWESFGTDEIPAKGAIIAQAGYSAAENIILFKMPANLKNGNAVIAAKDYTGKILWSWHIWVCEGWDPEKTAQTYSHDTGVIMDRNLGATSATPGEASALGLLYQWGRKDPFLGASSISENTEAASTLQWPEYVLSTAETGTVAYAVAHPTTFIASIENNYDWYYTGDFSTDNTRWQDEKTIFDPCPAGWRVPVGPTREHNGFWNRACQRSFVICDPDEAHFGVNLTQVFGEADPIWYPFAGFRTDMEGQLFSVGHNAGLWTSTADPDEDDPNAKVMAFGLDISYTPQGDIMVFPAIDYFRAFAHSVRCVKE